MALVTITKKEADSILAAAKEGNFFTLDKIVNTVANANGTSEGTVLATVRDEENGSTALHLAITAGHGLEYFADRRDFRFAGQLALNYMLFNQRDKDGRHALLLASRHNDVKYIEFVIHMRSSVTTVDYLGWTAIHYAARFNAYRVITHLIDEYGLAPDAIGYLGKTPAHIAAMADNLEAFKAVFLAQGGCEMPPDNDGLTPIDVAFRSGSAKIIQYLYQLGMGTGRAVPEAVEKQSLQNMKDVWEKHRGWNVVQEWLDGVPDGRPRKIHHRREWEEEEFPEEQAKRRRLN
ncbi:Ankyrin repeat-containing domain protein [Naviculisporaceae sp. PSN 640]